MAAKPGYIGRVKINGTVIGGATTWSYSGSGRAMEDDSEFGDKHMTFIPMQIEGGDITISGHFRLHDDAGQQALKTLFTDGTQITDIKLFIDETNDLYYKPDSTTTPASFVNVSKLDDVANAKAAIVSFSCTLKVSGILVMNSTTSEPSVETIGAHDPASATVEAVGELTGIGEEASVDCYFEYGKTTSYGSDTSASADTLTAAGLFHVQITGLDAETTYHFRAVVEKTDTSKIYGEDKTFTTTA